MNERTSLRTNEWLAFWLAGTGSVKLRAHLFVPSFTQLYAKSSLVASSSSPVYSLICLHPHVVAAAAAATMEAALCGSSFVRLPAMWLDFANLEMLDFVPHDSGLLTVVITCG